MKPTKRKVIMWSICFPVIIALIVGVVIANSYAISKQDTITSALCPPIITTDEQTTNATRAEGQALSDQLVQEGSVLVKNTDKTLPLDVENDTKVNVFGWNSIDWVFGGSGSGQVFAEGSDDLANTIGILDALEEYGVEYNKDLAQFYRNYHARVGDPYSISTFQSTFYRLYQPSINEYSADLLNGTKSFSDVALVVLGRRAGETEDPTRVQYKWNRGTDETRTYLEISTEEEELLKWVGSAGFKKVVVLINSTNVMELGFLDTIPGLDACLVVGATGTKGAEAIPSLLYGVQFGEDEDGEPTTTAVTPSGRFADTYAYDLESAINYNYTGDAGVGHYKDASGLYPENVSRNAGEQYTTATYVDYVEGIYVGYKWYETADAMGLWNGRTRTVLAEDGTEKTLTGYESVVQYPFGYGLSYTTFSWEVTSLTVGETEYTAGMAFTQNDPITLSVNVTNTGEVEGKDVVEVYVTVPYTPNGIEKAAVSLVGFAKTAALAPGNSQTVKIELDPYDFASYDCYDMNKNGFKGYELEKGDYLVKVMSDAHNVKTVTYGGSEVEGVFTLNIANDIRLETDKYTGAKVENLFTGDDAVESVPIDGSEASTPVQYISRAAFPDPYTFKKTEDRAITEAEKDYNLYSADKARAWDNADADIFGNPVDKTPVTWGKSGNQKVIENNALTELGIKLAQDYNAPEWESLLDQVTISEARSLAENGGWTSQAIESIGKPKLTDYDGPAQVRSFNSGSNKGTGFPCSATMCQTWSTNLVYTFGLNYGKEMNTLAVDGVYGFGCNLHRSPFAGRNYEYLSEDGFLSGVMLSQEVRGLKNVGKYTYLKHLALGECEHDREAMYTWLTEQSLREIYLKPFQMGIQEGGCVGLMSSYNRIGSVWTGGSEALITGVVRNEWGFNGAIVTDYADHANYMNGDQSVRAGADLSMAAKFNYGTIGVSDVENNPRLAHQLREIAHHVTYMYINAKYTNMQYNEEADVEQIVSTSSISSWVWWKPLLACLDVLFGAGMLIWIYFLIRPKGGWGNGKGGKKDA